MSPSSTTQQTPSLSLCLIARDEEANIGRALASVRPWVDEMVVVDTGSTDRTVQIARELGAEVYHHEWSHDFAAARNASLEHARGDWLLVMDADEELDQESAPLLRPSLAAADCDCLLLEILQLSRDGAHTLQMVPRLLRNRAGIRFQGLVHERPVGGDGRALRSRVRLVHHGFVQEPEVLEAKARRNLELVRRWLRQEPHNLEARIYQAQSLMALPDQVEDALRAAGEALALAQEQGAAAEQWPRIYHPLLMALTRLGRVDEVADHARQCLERLPDYPDPLYSLTWAEIRRRQWEEVCRAARRFSALQKRWREFPEQYPYTQNLTLNLGAVVMRRWLAAALQLDWEPEVREAFTRLLDEPGAEPEAQRVLKGLTWAKKTTLARELTAQAARRHPHWRWLSAGA